MRSAARLLAAGALAVLAVLAGCGVPTGGAPETIAPSDVPYGLLSPSSASPAPPPSPAGNDQPRVYLLSPADVLVPSGRDAEGTLLRDRLDDLIDELAAGPTATERNDELGTALPPGARLSVTSLDDGTVTIDLAGNGEAPSGRQSRLAVAQIVLTAASLPNVDAVLLTRDGEPLEAPLPSGELTTEPLTAADYQDLLVAPPP